MKRGRRSESITPTVESKKFPEVPPTSVHFGYRADRFPRKAGECRWWLSQGWNGQWDLISWVEKEIRERTTLSLNIQVFDYDEMCWD